jgi:hypothetical protein
MKRVLFATLVLSLLVISVFTLIYFISEPSLDQTVSKKAFSFLEDVVSARAF